MKTRPRSSAVDAPTALSPRLLTTLARGVIVCHAAPRPCGVDCTEGGDCPRYRWAADRIGLNPTAGGSRPTRKAPDIMTDPKPSVVLDDTTAVDGWKKSTFSGPNCDNCVEVAPFPGSGVALRSSRDESAPGLLFDTDEWRAFVAGVKAGEFDI